MIESIIIKYKSLWRFGIVGCSNTLVDFAVFTILWEFFRINYLYCQVAAYIAGIINSFVLNKVWTFESKTSNIESSRQLVKFIIINLFSLTVSLLGLRLLSGEMHLNVYFAKVAVTVITLAINYSGYKWWVFVK